MSYVKTNVHESRRSRKGGTSSNSNFATAADVLDRIDFVQDVLPALGLPAPRWGRIAAPWRQTRDGNLAIDPVRGVWFDHARNEGGGMLDFIARVRGGTLAEALEWCARLAGVRLDHQDGRRPAPVDLAAAQSWRRALLPQVERMLDDLSELLWLSPDDPPDSLQEVVGTLTKFRASLRDLTPRETAVLYAFARQRDPRRTARLVREGRADEEAASAWTAVMVRLLEWTGERSGPPPPEAQTVVAAMTSTPVQPVLFDHFVMAEMAP